jgi:hypothetical protein
MTYKKITKIDKEYIIFIIPIIYFIMILLSYDLSPKFHSDSIGYIEFSPLRTLGYPVVINIVGLDFLVPTQIIVFCLSLVWLGHEINKVIKNLYVNSFVLILICFTPDLINMQLSVLTESFFTSLIIIIIAALINFSFNRKLNYLILISVVVGIAASIRPVAYALVPAILFFVLFNSETKKKFLLSVACITLPCLLIISLERTAANIIFKDKIDSLLPRHLFAKSSMIDSYSNTLSTAEDNLTLKLLSFQNEDAEYIRRFISNAPSVEVKNVLTLYYEQCMQHTCFNDKVYLKNDTSRAKNNEIILRVSLERMLNNPTATLDLFFVHYKSLWTMYQVRHPNVFHVFNDYIEKSDFIPYGNFLFDTMPKKFSEFKLSYYLQPIFIFVGWVTFFIAFLYIFSALLSINISPFFKVSGILALIIHLEFSFTAFFGLGISRYSFVFFPVIFVSILFAFYGFHDYYLSNLTHKKND